MTLRGRGESTGKSAGYQRPGYFLHHGDCDKALAFGSLGEVHLGGSFQ